MKKKRHEDCELVQIHNQESPASQLWGRHCCWAVPSTAGREHFMWNGVICGHWLGCSGGWWSGKELLGFGSSRYKAFRQDRLVVPWGHERKLGLSLGMGRHTRPWRPGSWYTSLILGLKKPRQKECQPGLHSKCQARKGYITRSVSKITKQEKINNKCKGPWRHL